MSKHLARLSGAIGAVLAAIVVMAPLAQAETPDPSYARFAGCPSPKTENPAIKTCVRGVIAGGHARLGKKEVPFSVPTTFSGGVDDLFGGSTLFASPSGGMEPVKQPIPGGLIGSTKLDWLANILGAKQLALYAVTEVVGPPSMSVTKINLPIRVHLINSVLGNNCYIGSPAKPIMLNMTTETTSPPPPNKPITGNFGFLQFDPVLEIQSVLDRVMVDNAFAVPGVSGCALNLFGGALSINIDKLVNSKLGLPAPAGTNEVVQEIDIELVNAEFVYP